MDFDLSFVNQEFLNTFVACFVVVISTPIIPLLWYFALKVLWDICWFIGARKKLYKTVFHKPITLRTVAFNYLCYMLDDKSRARYLCYSNNIEFLIHYLHKEFLIDVKYDFVVNQYLFPDDSECNL